MTSITPYLWFDDNLEQAIEFYTSVFPNARVGTISRYGEGMPLPAGTVMAAEFELAGQKLMALNGGPMFSFTEAVSFFVSCADQAEVDRYWDALTADGGQESQCGWLKDRFGLSWQIVPVRLGELMADEDRARAGAVVMAMLQMRRLDIAALEAAADAASASSD